MTEWNPTPGRADFVRSVQKRIEEKPDVFPTERQEVILSALYRSLERKHLTDVEKEAREFLGLPTE